jgi:hypothetical protein
MNRKLMAALAAVLVATLYLQTQEDDELLATREPGAAPQASRSSQVPRGESGGPRVIRSGAGTEASATLAPWVTDALVDGARAWQRRQREASAPAPMAMTMARSGQSAWSAAQAPSPVVIHPPEPAETVVIAAPAPVAPRFPHQWVGRFNDGAVLSGPEATWVVQAGDVIDGQWRVERVEERRMSLTYLPLNLPQQIVMR